MQARTLLLGALLLVGFLATMGEAAADTKPPENPSAAAYAEGGSQSEFVGPPDPGNPCRPTC